MGLGNGPLPDVIPSPRGRLVLERSGFQMAGHMKVTMILCILKTARERGQWGGEGIYSTVIEKRRLLCKYTGHTGGVGS